MEFLIIIIQVLIAVVIANVWFIRKNKLTKYRGGSSTSLKDEFKAYGYPDWFFYFIFVLKTTLALFIFSGIWFESFLYIGSIGMTLLMLGAIFSHIKIKDSFIKVVPATVMFCLSAFLVTSFF